MRMTDEQIASRMARIRAQVRYASQPSIMRTIVGETIVLLGLLAALLFLYVSI
jgi:F0F1-type ATP synthase membrane subunit c/vacuolar-type H+-ATPase subunit K